ncbi:MAG: carboxymuconolactone decarboxylase family protein [Paludibacteraceae bacterium]|nr:carboxymuconolactone decarboxylase family protein [Paludibacteraceae bacterium]
MNIKQIIPLAMLAVLSACGNSKQSESKDMNTLTFNEKQAACMSAIACNEAQGDLVSLESAIHNGLEADLTVSQIKEALSQLYAYTGFPRSLNALGVLQRVVDDRQAKGMKVLAGNEASALPKDYDALKQGTEVQTQLSGQPFNYDFCPAEDYYLKAHLFGDIFARDVLTHADRELVTVSALAGLKGVEPQLNAHVRGARNMGVTDEQLQQIPVALAANGCKAAASRALKAVNALLGVEDNSRNEYDQVDLKSYWRRGNPNDAYAQYFTGRSYVSPYGESVVNVTFEPGCRNNWHVHHGAVQVLICVYGHGWYQEWGKPAVELKEGVVIEVPEGVKHWHGAAKGSWLQHLTYHKNLQPNPTNEWLEAVSEEEYNKLK